MIKPFEEIKPALSEYVKKKAYHDQEWFNNVLADTDCYMELYNLLPYIITGDKRKTSFSTKFHDFILLMFEVSALDRNDYDAVSNFTIDGGSSIKATSGSVAIAVMVFDKIANLTKMGLDKEDIDITEV